MFCPKVSNGYYLEKLLLWNKIIHHLTTPLYIRSCPRGTIWAWMAPAGTDMKVYALERPYGIESACLEVHICCLVFFNMTPIMKNDTVKLTSKRQIDQLSGRIQEMVMRPQEKLQLWRCLALPELSNWDCLYFAHVRTPFRWDWGSINPLVNIFHKAKVKNVSNPPRSIFNVISAPTLKTKISFITRGGYIKTPT